MADDIKTVMQNARGNKGNNKTAENIAASLKGGTMSAAATAEPTTEQTAAEVAAILGTEQTATQPQSAIGRIMFTPTDSEQSKPRENAKTGEKTRFVARCFVQINAIDLPHLLTPINVYKRLEKGAKTFTITANLAGKPQGGDRVTPYFSTDTAAVSVPQAAATLIEKVIEEYKDWSKTEAAKIVQTARRPNEVEGGSAEDF